MKAWTATVIATAGWLVLSACGGSITLGSNGGPPFDDAGATGRAAETCRSAGPATGAQVAQVTADMNAWAAAGAQDN